MNDIFSKASYIVYFASKILINIPLNRSNTFQLLTVVSCFNNDVKKITLTGFLNVKWYMTLCERWLFCWYWWKRWPSLFKLSFHNVKTLRCSLLGYDIQKSFLCQTLPFFRFKLQNILSHNKIFDRLKKMVYGLVGT